MRPRLLRARQHLLQRGLLRTWQHLLQRHLLPVGRLLRRNLLRFWQRLLHRLRWQRSMRWAVPVWPLLSTPVYALQKHIWLGVLLAGLTAGPGLQI